jgi:hypothetical protein
MLFPTVQFDTLPGVRGQDNCILVGEIDARISDSSMVTREHHMSRVGIGVASNPDSVWMGHVI